MSVATDPATSGRAFLNSTGTGVRKLRVLDAIIAANPSFDNSQLSDYIAANPNQPAVPVAATIGEPVVNLRCSGRKLARWIAGEFPGIDAMGHANQTGD